MTCQEMLFRVNTEVDARPGEYDIQVNELSPIFLMKKLYYLVTPLNIYRFWL